MSPAPVPPSLDPALVALITAAITAMAGYAVARVGVKSKSVEKAPEVQDQINKAVSGLIDHYSKALAEEKARHTSHVQELEDRLDRAFARMETLTMALRNSNIPVPDED